MNHTTELSKHPTGAEHSPSAAIAQCQAWLERVVLGLNLCPFAKRPYQLKQVRMVGTGLLDIEAIVMLLQSELERLAATPAEQIETSLIIFEDALRDFNDYLDLIDLLNGLILARGWQGVFQVASFHPDYCFEACPPDDPANWTNRSPLPIVHLLREDSIEQALQLHPSPETIPERNMDLLRNMSEAERSKLFKPTGPVCK